jgi:hypothetical protein
MSLRNLILLPLLTVTACSGPSKPAHFDLTTRAPQHPGDPYSLLRVANYNDNTPQDQINAIGLTSDYLFAAVNWAGVYRFPKYGGAVATVQEGGSSPYGFLATNSKTVFWDDASFDRNDSPGGQIMRRSAAGGAATAIAPIKTGMANITADEENFYYVTAPPIENGSQSFEIYRQSLAGGAVAKIFTLTEGEPAVHPFGSPFSPSFIVDGGDTFVVTDSYTEVDVVPAGSTSAKKLFDLPSGDLPTLGGVDANWLYLSGGHSLYRAPRAGGTINTLYTLSDTNSFVRLVATDDKNLYFIQNDASGSAIYAIPTSGGTPARIGRSNLAYLSVATVAQDERNLYIVGQGEILMLPKTPMGTVN